MQSLVSTDWLSEHLDDPDLVVLDCTNYAELEADGQNYKTTSGRKCWSREHIPRSGHADFTGGLAGDATQYRNTLPDPEQFAAAMGNLGVGDESRVVLYDSVSSMWAARVWWMLRWIGFDNAAVLDGGWLSWKAESRRTTSGPCKHTRARLTPRVRPELFITKSAIKEALGIRSTCLVDALSEAQFYGRESNLGLSGHIPGAVNIPATSLIDPKTGRYLPLAILAECFTCDPDQRTIVYCGSGIAAASDAFTMIRLGFEDIAIYMPGLQEWVCDDDAPLVNGPI